MKTFFKILSKIVLYIIGIILSASILFILGLFGVFNQNPPKPKIKYAEFPIKVTCRVSGEEYTIEDTVICEYKGVKNVGIGGKTRVWEQHLKNNDVLTIMSGDENGRRFDIIKSYGRAEYYMGDSITKWNEYEITNTDYYDIFYLNEKGNVIEYKTITSEDAFEKYGFELVSVEYTPPLVGNCD